MAFIDLHITAQGLLYFLMCICGLVISITVGVNRVNKFMNFFFSIDLDLCKKKIFHMLLRRSISDHYLRSCGYVTFSRPQRTATGGLEPGTSQPKVLGFTTVLFRVFSDILVAFLF